MRIAMIGAPGSGKGTQSKLLAQRYRVPHISTGELLRQAVQSDKAFSKEARQRLETGLLVDDEIVRSLLEDRLRQRDTKRGFVIDGYPRNIPQAQSLDNLLGMLGRGLQISVYNQVSEDALIKRNTGRLTCAKCGAIYNRFLSPPAKKGVCDQCGGNKLQARKEDNEKTVATRVESYKAFITPLVTYYKAQHKLRTVSAMGSVEEIHEKICAIVDLEIRPLEIDAMVSAGDTYSEGGGTVIAGGKINRVAASTEPKPVRKPASKASKASGPAAGKPVKKSATKKKTTATRAAVAKSSENKPAAKKTTAKKATASKAPVRKKAATGKVTAKKTTAKKTAATKPVRKKTAAAKPAAKKTTKKKAPRAATTKKKSTSKKVATKKAPARKTTARKTTAKKKATKKSTARKTTASKTAAKATANKAAAGKSATRKKAGKKTGKKK